MKKIDGVAKSVSEILKGTRYSIDYYQREYRWEAKQIQELIGDLTSRFLEAYDPGHPRKAVEDYPYYFLGSIIISEKDGRRFVVDGQQRLTSLTLLLTHLRHLAASRPDVDPFDDLVYSTRFGERSFNLDVEDRRACMEALFEGHDINVSGLSESVQNLVARYADIANEFPHDLAESALPYFVDWLIHKVQVVEITARSDADAYTIFESVHDRGLQLKPIDLVKGYLLSNIEEGAARRSAGAAWRDRVLELAEYGKDIESDFLKTWLRSQYAQKIREHRKGAVPEDWDRIGTEFHLWLRDRASSLGLRTSADFEAFLAHDFNAYSGLYLNMLDAANSLELDPGLEFIGYNHDRDFTLQNQLLLAPVSPDDTAEDVATKVELVSRFVDITLTRRLWNNRSIAYAYMSTSMFDVVRSIRRVGVEDLAGILHGTLAEQAETFATNDRFAVNQQNRWQLHRTLARITDHVGMGSGEPSRYLEYTGAVGRVRYEIEHVWANHPERHAHEFARPAGFGEHRNLVGGLLLLPKSLTASSADAPYQQKVGQYLSQNLLAGSLHPRCRENNPGFDAFVRSSGLPFEGYEEFTAESIVERGELYRQIAEQVWDPDDLLRVAKTRR